MEYNKLIRDKIPTILDEANVQYEIMHTNEYTHMSYLLKKLQEEYLELSQDKNLNELADVMEVLLSIGKYLGYSLEDILYQTLKKREERGSFDEGIVLLKTRTPLMKKTKE